MSEMNQNSPLVIPSMKRGAASSQGGSRRVSLGVKLPLAVIGSLLIAFAIYTFISIRISQNALTQTLQSELQAQVVSKADVLQSNLIGARNVALDLAAFAESSAFAEENVLRVIHNTLERNDQVFGSAIAYEPYQFQPNLYLFSPYYSRGTDGALHFTQLGTSEYDYFRRDWYAVPKSKLAPVISPPYFNYGGGDIWMVTWSAPFFKDDGTFRGVATADIAFSQTQDLINNLQVGQSGYAFLLDSSGIILGIGEHGGNYKIMSDSMVLAAYTPKTNHWIELVSDMRSGKSGFIEATDPQGRRVFVAYSPVGLDTGWSLALAYPRDELFATTYQLQNTLIIYTILVVLVFGALLLLFTRSITNPLRQLREFTSRVSEGNLSGAEAIHIQTHDELEDLGNAFNQMSNSLRTSFDTLESNVASRTRDLARLANELQTIAEVTRELAIIRDLKTLLNVSANLIRERLGYYHVGIFLVDERGEYAILRGASSVAAEQMLARNYKLKVGETGLVGNVTQTGQAYIALDVGTDAVHFENPLLPDTRSEIVLPLRSYNVTIGALDIQASFPNAFDERDVQTLQTLADQLAAAIENALLVQRLEGTLNELSKATRTQTRQVWKDAVSQKGMTAYEYDGLQIRPMPQDLAPSLANQLENGRPVVTTHKNGSNEIKNTLLVPLMVLDQLIGVIGLEQEDATKTWSEEQIAIAQAAANRAALTLENARLLEESRRRANKERTIFEATNRIGNAVSMENILQTTAEELERVLSGSEVIIQFTDDETSGKQ